jgi:hypothetical protein
MNGMNRTCGLRRAVEDIMKIEVSHQNERGVALVISLMFLAILAMLGTTAYVMTSTDLKIGSNYRQYAQTFYEANGGVQFVIGTLENDLKDGTTIANGTVDVLPTLVGSSEPFTATPSGLSVTISNITMISDSPRTYSFSTIGRKFNSGAKVAIEVTFKRDFYDPAFGVGIVADRDITIHGAPIFKGECMPMAISYNAGPV